MAWMHPLAVEHRRKLYTRQDAWRLAPPGTPEAKMPGWLDPSATRVRWREAQEAEARRQAAAEQETFDREVLALRHDLAKLEYEWQRFQRKYSPNQPRDELGRWTDAGGASQSDATDSTAAPQADGQVLSDETPDPIRPGAQYAQMRDFGTLIAEIPIPGGRRCVYNFGSMRVVAPGPTSFPCQPTVHWSGVVHGRLLNDN